MKNYYTTFSVDGGYRGRIYTYDQSGDREKIIWESDEIFDTDVEAEDAAVDYADANKINVELG